MSPILQRTITGSIYISIIIASLLFHPIYFALVITLLNYFGTKELSKLNSQTLNFDFQEGIWINNLAVFLSAILISLDLNIVAFTIPIIALLILLLTIPVFKKIENAINNLSIPIVASVYISIPLILLLLIHKISLEIEVPFTLAIFIIIWTNDTFAYLSGMAFGRHRLFERISPKKSWEGFFGGSVMGIVAALLFNYFYPETNTIVWIGFAILCSISAVFGDFIESLLKRNAGVKDSGAILPGHGGILDRIDSMLLVSPVIYIYLFFVIL